MPTPPKATKKPHNITTHNHTRVDDYFWMRKRDAPEVLAYLEAENAYVAEVLAPQKQLREDLFIELRNRLPEADESAHTQKGAYTYYQRFEKEADYAVHYRYPNGQPEAAQIYWHEPERAKSHAYYSVGALSFAPNNQLLAVTEDTVSRRQYTLRIQNAATGEFYAETIDNVQASDVAWAADSSALFYIRKDPTTLLGYQVYKHFVGTDPAHDVLIYEEADNQFYLSLHTFKSGNYLAIECHHGGNTSDWWLLDRHNLQTPLQQILTRETGHEYELNHANGRFVVRSNRGNAPNYALYSATAESLHTPQHWQTLVAHNADNFLAEFELFDNHMVYTQSVQGLNQLVVFDFATNNTHHINFDEPCYAAALGANYNANATSVRFVYSSLTTPRQIWDFDLVAHTRALIKQQQVVGDFDAKNYTTERHWAIAADGTKVPISLVYKHGITLPAPTLQYGYGSYGSSTDAGFSAHRLSLLDRGFVYAIAHIRGGQEMGRHWYEQGRLQHKQNSFSDFAAVGQYLIDKNFTTPEQLCALGGSAGGLLMGAVANQNPALYHAIVAKVPFVDVVSTMLDDTIPLTTGEYLEWGNPNVAADYHTMLAYSPYDQVVRQDYPHMLVVTGYHDSQVQYWEPAKWVAKLRDYKTNDNLLLFNTDMGAGHGGASGRYGAIHDVALDYAFLLRVCGLG